MSPPRPRRPRRDAQDRAAARLLRRTAVGVAGLLALAVLGALVRQAGFLAAPYVLQFAIDDGVAAGDARTTALWCGVVVAAAVAQFLGVCVWEQYANLADARAGARLRTRVREGALRGADGLGTGDLVVRAGRDVDVVRSWVHGLPTWAVIGVTVGVLVPGLAALDPWLLVVAVATAPCLAVLSVVYPRRFERAAAHAAEAHGRRADVVDRVVRSAVTVRGTGAHRTVLEQHRTSSAELSRRSVRASDLLARWTALGEGVPAIATAVGVLVGVLAVADGRLTVGGLVTFSGWMATVGIAVRVGLARWTQTVDARVGARRLVDVLADGADVPRPAPVRTLALRGVVPVAGAAPIDLDLVPGRLAAVTGPTGSGKSVLLRVLAGQASPVAGTVLADGAPVDGRTGGACYVPQRPLVMAGTVRDNLALGLAGDDPAADDARYRAALSDVGLDVELAGRAADPLDLVLGDAGTALSGGQAQRLALARALVADPPVLLLDDVGSAVDGVTGERLRRVVRQAAADRVVVVAGHGPAVDAADDVVRLQAGAGVPA